MSEEAQTLGCIRDPEDYTSDDSLQVVRALRVVVIMADPAW